jgi:hypothetical protein
MKQLLFLLLFPCLALAQYPNNGNQKMTLGEQTSADGLVFRGLAADTTRKPSVDTMAFILLDTNTNIIWQYKKAVNNAWTRVGGSISSGVTGVLPVANGGTNAGEFTEGSVVFAGASGTYTQDNSGLFYNNTNDRLGIGTASPQSVLHIKSANPSQFTIETNTTTQKSHIANDNTGSLYLSSNRDVLGNIDDPTKPAAIIYMPSISENSNIQFWTSAVNATITQRMIINKDGNVGIGTGIPAVQFHTTGAVRFAGLASITDLRTDADGDLFNGSDFNLKNSIDTINFGLSDVLKLKPVSFNWNDEARNINEYKSMGFIAQDVMNVIPNAASTMGDGDMQVDYNAIVATLTKAIQEQQAFIKALEQRILILENK